jgi:hypothetical protein
MSLVAVLGDAVTTTTLALAAAWPAEDEVVVLEADPSGGDLVAWLDVPEQPGLSSAVAAGPAPSWPVLSSHIQTTATGLRVLVAPVRAVEASVVIREAAARVTPTLAALNRPTVLADCGAQHPAALSPVVTQAGLALVVIRQPRVSGRAAAARLDRVGELVDALHTHAVPTAAVLIGGSPYGADEVSLFLGGASEPLPTMTVADDPLGAQLLAGRPGTKRRASRTALLRSAAPVAAELAARVRAVRPALSGGRRS